PTGCRRKVLGNPEAARVDLGDERLRRRVPLLGARKREGESSEEVPALIGAIGLVDSDAGPEDLVTYRQRLIPRLGAGSVGVDADGQAVEVDALERELDEGRVLAARRCLLCERCRRREKGRHDDEADDLHGVRSQAATFRPMNSQPSASKLSAVASGSERTLGISMVSAHQCASSRSEASIWPESGPNRM